MIRFECRYAMYMHHRGVASCIQGENLKDAIRNRNQSAILVWVEDEDGTEYFCKEHDKPDADGYFNYYWVDENGKVFYDEEDDAEYKNEEAERIRSLIKPTLSIPPDARHGWIDTEGKFYKCSWEGHREMADLLLEHNIVNKPTDESDPDIKSWLKDNGEHVLEKRKWCKLSSGEVRYRCDKLNAKQRKVLINWAIDNGRTTISVFGRNKTFEEFENDI